MSNLYARRETEDQGEHYLRHLDAMTREKLFDKCAIAAELAHRDMEIDRLRAAMQEAWPVLHYYGHAPGEQHVNSPPSRRQAQDACRLAREVLSEPQPLPARDQEHDGHDGHL